MPITPRVIELADLFRAQLLRQEGQAAAVMIRYYGLIWQDLQSNIDALNTEIEQLRAAGEIASADKITRLTRTRNVQRQAAEELVKFAEYAGNELTNAQRAAIVAGERSAYQMTLAAFPPNSIDVKFWRMPVDAVETIAGFAADGTPLYELIRQAVGDSVGAFMDRLVTGLAEGLNPRVIARDLRNDFGMALTRTLRIARTEQLRAYRAATLGSYQASGVVKAWQRHAARGNRTCMACIMLDGKIYQLDEQMDDHPNGRCAMLPVTATYAELGIDAPEPQFNQESAREWFERQDEGTQRTMMGNTLFDAWKEGRVDLEKIPKLTKNDIWGNSWTVAPLKELIGESQPDA